MRCRPDYKFIVNEYKKFQDFEAIRIRDQPMFLDTLKDHILNNNYFLFGCDSCTIVEQLYNECLKDVREEDKDKFLIITINNKLEITNASEQFKNKFVFFSPSITTGVDFSIEDKQDVFIYIHGQSIDPSQAFQQTTRCRNINKLFYYSESKSFEPNYKSVEEVEKSYLEFIETSEKLNQVCKTINDDYDEVMSQNDFFKIYCYNEYIKDIFRTNKTIHYQHILRDANFKLISDEDIKPIQFSKEQMTEFKEDRIEKYDNLFDEYIHSNEDDKTKGKFETINNNIEVLNLPDNNEILIQYKEYIMNRHKLDDHMNIMRLLKSNDYIKNKLDHIHQQNQKVKILDNIYNKISLLRNYEKSFSLKPLEVNYKPTNEIDIPDKDWALMKKVFRTKKDKPTNMTEFKPIYIQMIKHITNNEICNTMRDRSGSKGRTTSYDLNTKYIQEHIELNKYSNPKALNFDHHFYELFNIEPVKFETIEKNEEYYNLDKDDNVWDE